MGLGRLSSRSPPGFWKAVAVRRCGFPRICKVGQILSTISSFVHLLLWGQQYVACEDPDFHGPPWAQQQELLPLWVGTHSDPPVLFLGLVFMTGTMPIPSPSPTASQSWGTPADQSQDEEGLLPASPGVPTAAPNRDPSQLGKRETGPVRALRSPCSHPELTSDPSITGSIDHGTSTHTPR